MRVFSARDVEGIDERAAIAEDRLVVTALLYIAACSGEITRRSTTGDSVCVARGGQTSGGYPLFALGRFAQGQAPFRKALEPVEQGECFASVTSGRLDVLNRRMPEYIATPYAWCSYSL